MEINGTNNDDVDVNVDHGHYSNHDHHHQLTKQEVDPTTIVENFESLDLQGNGQSTNLGSEKEKQVKSQKYPLRNNAVDCVYYTKTGSCKYGSNCMFNHSLKRVFKVVGEKEKVDVGEKNELVSDADKTECKYFSTPGGCKYGDTCKYSHTTKKTVEEEEAPELNFLGLPIRPLEKECTFFMRHGTCGYGASCVFHHPNPSLPKEFDSDSPKTSEVLGSSEVSQDTNLRNTSIDSYHQETPQIYERSHNQVSMTLNKPCLPHQIVKTADPATYNEHLLHIEEFPERPGQPDCDYFMRTGDCKYRSACRYNHPLTRVRKLRLPPLSLKDSCFRSAKILPLQSTDFPYSKSKNATKNDYFRHHHHQQQPQEELQNGEYPERPGQPECEYFMKNGDCKFKSSCRYHHPRNQVSTTSLSEKGLPLRPGIKVCRHFQQNGTCKYGRTCQFHHPDDFAKTFALQDHGSTHVLGPTTDSNIPINNNAGSEWGDTWENVFRQTKRTLRDEAPCPKTSTRCFGLLAGKLGTPLEVELIGFIIVDMHSV